MSSPRVGSRAELPAEIEHLKYCHTDVILVMVYKKFSLQFDQTWRVPVFNFEQHGKLKIKKSHVYGQKYTIAALGARSEGIQLLYKYSCCNTACRFKTRLFVSRFQIDFSRSRTVKNHESGDNFYRTLSLEYLLAVQMMTYKLLIKMSGIQRCLEGIQIRSTPLNLDAFHCR